MPVQVPNPGVPFRCRDPRRRGRRPRLRDAAVARERHGQRCCEECPASEGGMEERVVFDFDFDVVESSIWILDLPAMVDCLKEASWRSFKNKSSRLITTRTSYT